ncbi:MAG: hypothetical protein HND46_23845 [Chloroflexi bacterium]|nr:hypothetical protein [Chloroflexota bacterium]
MMDLDTTVQVGTLLSIIVGIIAFFWGVKSYNQQMNTQVFLTYTQRIEQIMDSFPKDAWDFRLDLEQLPKPSLELSTSVLKYLNLCSEEYYLWQKKLLASDLWNIWEGELNRTLRSPLFVREWKSLAKEFEFYPEFRQYVENIQNQAGQVV